jgi:cytochrome P450 family 142 subfamily A polypeptide 1
MSGPPDLLDGTFYRDDPYPTYRWMREHAPAYRDNNGIWALSRYDDVVEASRHPERFSSAGGSRPASPALPHMIDQDEPRHTRQRRLVYKGFTPRQVAAIEDHARGIVTRIIDGVAERGQCDFVADVAVPLPLTVIGEMLGIPAADHHLMQVWSDEMIKGADGHGTNATTDAYLQYRAYELAIIEARWAAPTDDLTSILVHATIDEERLTDEELLHELLLLLVGGNETTRNVISGAMEALIAHPLQRQALIEDPSLLPEAVEEFIRWVTPILTMNRTTTADLTLHGETIPAQASVLLMYGSANRDEAHFVDPDHFDIRRHPNPHLSFGFGPHFCLGACLARLEIRVMFEELLERLPDVELAPGATVERSPSSFIRGITTMPVVFTPA